MQILGPERFLLVLFETQRRYDMLVTTLVFALFLFFKALAHAHLRRLLLLKRLLSFSARFLDYYVNDLIELGRLVDLAVVALSVEIFHAILEVIHDFILEVLQLLQLCVDRVETARSHRRLLRLFLQIRLAGNNLNAGILQLTSPVHG